MAQLIRSTSWLLEVVAAVRDLGPPGAYVAAGAVRDTVWDALTGRSSPGPFADVDVVYCDAMERAGASSVHAGRLRGALPHLDWEVTNQATVHVWHREAQGLHTAPHRTVAEGLATWPETATAVGVRLDAEGALDIVAPFGLDDLFALRVRHNPALVSRDTFLRRVESKRWLQRWPELELLAAP